MKVKVLEPFSLVSLEDIQKIVMVATHRPKEDNKRALILLVVFCVLFVTLLTSIFFRSGWKRLPLVNTAPANVPSTVVSISSTPQVSPTPTVKFIALETLRVKVVNSSGVPNQAAKVKQSLVGVGFKQVSISSSSTVTASKNQISISSRVSPESRQILRQIVENVVGKSSETELVDVSDFDILVTITFNPGN